MDNVTIISYPGPKDNSLLSLTDTRSRYMLPFGGRFRVIDFTLRNSFFAAARTTFIYSTEDESLESYVERYGPFAGMKFPPIRVVSREYSDMNTCYNLILDSNTKYYVIYNGDIPSILDFKSILQKYRAGKSRAMLFKIQIGDRASMAYKVLVIDQKTLLKTVNQAIDEKRTSPNIFEMVINIMVNAGVKTGSINAMYLPIKAFQILRLIGTLSSILKYSICSMRVQLSRARSTPGIRFVGPMGGVRSFVSDHCTINGTVSNSIISPGVEIGEGAQVRDSIILPFVKIGPGARIYRSIIDERTNRNPENVRYDIDMNCKIGTESAPIKNSDFPESLFAGITLIGKDCLVHNEARIGGGCYVASGFGDKYFAQKKFLYDGTSVLK